MEIIADNIMNIVISYKKQIFVVLVIFLAIAIRSRREEEEWK